ncbi:MAG: trypsin-like peptidase domain-containing protein, partial [Candidatus Baltobacteraceae bacterium]
MRCRTVALFLASITCVACARSGDAFVRNVRAIRPSVVLLTMKVPPEHKRDAYDEAYASGTVVATGKWGSDILTVAHAVKGAWDLRITIDNRRRAPAKVVASDDDLDVALVRTPAAN